MEKIDEMEKRGAGRPQFNPTAAQRRRVEELKSGGMSIVEICQAIGVADDTLKKHFADELQHGSSRRRAERIELLYKAARKGSVPAIRALEQMSAAGDAADAAAEFEAKVQAPRKLGKKEQAEEAANSAGIGTDWGTDLQVPPVMN